MNGSRPNTAGALRDHVRDTWLLVEMPRKLRIKGVAVVGDQREVIPLQRNFQVQVRRDGRWITAGEVRDAKTKIARAVWAEPLETDAVRIVVPAKDYPRSPWGGLDGFVRIAEVLLVLPDGKETTLPDLFCPDESGR